MMEQALFDQTLASDSPWRVGSRRQQGSCFPSLTISVCAFRPCPRSCPRKWAAPICLTQASPGRREPRSLAASPQQECDQHTGWISGRKISTAWHGSRPVPGCGGLELLATNHHCLPGLLGSHGGGPWHMGWTALPDGSCSCPWVPCCS